jgi:dTDP-glucose pyrophosphorylase
MGALTASTPKPLLPLKGKPIIEHILIGLRSAGIRAAVLVIGHHGGQIADYLGDGSRLGMQLTYRSQPRPEGTARALLLARDATPPQPFVVSWGDIVIEPADYASLLGAFERTPCDALLLVNETDDPWRGAAVYVDDDWRVTGLVEKPRRGSSRTRWNLAGVFVCTPVIFTYAEALRVSPRGEYELPQAIAAMIADGRPIRAQPVRGFWSDLGTPEDLVAAEHALPAHGERPSRDGAPRSGTRHD